jgi:3-phosphoshikimate 1-carboxyvinyltransferase
MRRIVEPLSQMGARIEGAHSSSGSTECHPPLTIDGRRPLRAFRYQMPVASAQVKSAILLAGLFADGRTTVVERHPTRDHTERLLRHFGLGVSSGAPELSLEPGVLRSPGHLVLPGDFSSAAFFLIAASCVSGSRLQLRDVGLNPTRIALLDVLSRMGARVEIDVTESSWEPRGVITIEACPLRGITLGADEVPGVIDELPILMVAAACAQGTTRLLGIGELRVKETDRIQSMVMGLQQFGVRIRVTAQDAVEIDGGSLSGGTVDSAGDHRTAMSLTVAGLVAEGTTVVREAACIAKSFPEFFDLLRELAGSTTVKTVDKAGPLC